MIAHSQSDFLLGDRLVRTGFFDAATPIGFREFKYTPAQPQVAVVVPVHNQSAVIVGHLESILRNLELTAELIIILDGCRDGTPDVVHAWAAGFTPRANLSRLVLLQSEVSLYETISDNLGVACSTAPAFIEVQADMEIEEFGFDRRLVAALRSDDSLLAVSGRGGHDEDELGLEPKSRPRWVSYLREQVRRLFNKLHFARGRYEPSVIEHWLSNQIGRCGTLTDLPVGDRNRDTLYYMPTVMRGPLVVDRRKFDVLGGFDAQHFFLANDDHDLMARAWTLQGWRCAYLSVAYASPRELGSTRAKKSPEDAKLHRSYVMRYTEAQRSSLLRSGQARFCQVRDRRRLA